MATSPYLLILQVISTFKNEVMVKVMTFPLGLVGEGSVAFSECPVVDGYKAKSLSRIIVLLHEGY